MSRWGSRADAATTSASQQPADQDLTPRPEVRALQGIINNATAQRLTVDGVFGPKTKAALQFLQKRLGLPETGEPDTMTLVLAHARIEDSRRKRAASRRFILQLPKSPSPTAPPRRRHLLVDVPAHMFIGRELEEGGLAGYEPETLAVFLAALARRGDGVVLDVGANIGVFAMLAGALSDWRVFGFEPTPELAAAARRVAEANSLQITMEEVALGRETGVATFYLSDVTDASNSLAAGFRPSTKHLVVPVEALDEWSARTGMVPQLIKIDTETTEPDVLAGSRALLHAHRPWLLLEVLPGHRRQDLIDELSPLGYSWYHIIDGEPLLATDTLTPTDPNRNWLFTPEPIDDAFLADVDAWRAALAALAIAPEASVEA
ncbi:MAG: hypothetical protein QOC60_1064 [Frankiaceae bacterium]|nr:hypothetical protein [Frankiaceae bacterium]